MAAPNRRDGGDELTRRTYLATLGAVGLGGLAGCGGDGGGDPTPTPDPGDGPCAAPPYEYERRDLPVPSGAGDAVATAEVPATGPSVTTRTAQLAVEFERGQLTVTVQRWAETTVSERVETSTNEGEVTGQFDVPGDAAVVTVHGGTTPASVRVLLPAGAAVVGVSVLGRNVEDCSGAIETVRNRLVDTVALI